MADSVAPAVLQRAGTFPKVDRPVPDQAPVFEETCENCRFLAADDTCGNPESVYHLRPAVYRDGDEVLQAGWCDRWEDVRSKE